MVVVAGGGLFKGVSFGLVAVWHGVFVSWRSSPPCSVNITLIIRGAALGHAPLVVGSHCVVTSSSCRLIMEVIMDPAMAKERDENVAEARRIQVLNEQVGPASRFVCTVFVWK